jgi:hypothetical protein
MSQKQGLKALDRLNFIKRGIEHELSIFGSFGQLFSTMFFYPLLRVHAGYPLLV